MRTEDQIKRKLYELNSLIQNSTNEERNTLIRTQIEMLEWVLNEPVEKYHVEH